MYHPGMGGPAISVALVAISAIMTIPLMVYYAVGSNAGPAAAAGVILVAAAALFIVFASIKALRDGRM
jgi:hypothetical protein